MASWSARGAIVIRAALFLLLALLPTSALSQADQPAEQRIALVIGVSNYGGAATLPNTLNDARLVKSALEETGFHVTLLTDPTNGQLREAVRTLYDQANAAGANTTVLFYYAGHAVQFGGDNYLIPARTDLFTGAPTASDFIDQAVRAQWVLSRLREARVARVLMILDACRTNPIDRSVVGGDVGLAQMSAAAGGAQTMIVFSAEPSQSAYEGANGSSYFAQAFAQFIRVPGFDIADVFNNVSREVTSQTGNRQRPTVQGMFPFQFKAGAVVDASNMRAETPASRLQGPEDSDQLLQEALRTRTMAQIRRDADAGDAESIYLLAFATLEGKAGVEKNVPEALRLTRAAAIRGVPRAANLLGWLYAWRDEVPRDLPQAIDWFRSAADLGLPIAMSNLGTLYRDGTGVPVDIDAAERYFQQAAQRGNSAGWINWASLYASDTYGRRNLARAEAIREQGYAAGIVDMAEYIGDAYRYGRTGETTDHNPQRALEIYLSGAQAGCKACWRQAASLYTSDELGSADPAMAYTLYHNGAEVGDADSMLEAARALGRGNGVAEDDASAFQLYQRAAGLGNVEANGNVGLSLARGQGVRRDPARAATILREVLAYDLNPDKAIRHQVYAPNYWGFAAALAELLEAHAVPEATEGEARQLRARYGEANGSMKRFTVPIDCAGSRTPFYIYIVNWDRPNDETPVESQAEWLSEARGCTVPADVLESFHKLKQIARENNVSFVDLCVYALGAAQAEQNRATTGQPSQQQAASTQPPLPSNEELQEAHFRAGTEFMRHNDYQHAVLEYDQTISTHPNFALAYYGRGVAKMSLRDWPHAIEDLTAFLRLQPEDGADVLNLRAEVLRIRSQVYRATDQPDLALADLNESLRIKPHDPATLNERGLFYSARGDHAGALADFDASVAADDKNPAYRNSACWERALYFPQDLDRGREDCDAAVRLSENNPEYLDSRAMLALKQGRFQDAWNDWDSAFRANPRRGHFLYGRGIAELRLGRTQEGQADLQAAIALDAQIAETYAGYGVSP